MSFYNAEKPTPKKLNQKSSTHKKYSSIRIPLFILLFIVLFVTLFHHFHRFTFTLPIYTSTALVVSLSTVSPPPTIPPPPPPTATPILAPTPSPRPSSLETVSILIPDWVVLAIVFTDTLYKENFTCVFPNNEKSSARFVGKLPFRNETSYKCEFPVRNRRKLPFLSPKLVRTEDKDKLDILLPVKELIRWNFVVYDSFTTENDVVLLVKGINNCQGINRPSSDFNCVFGDSLVTAVKTPVTSAIQEVFRCPRPKLTSNDNDNSPISMTIEILESNGAVTTIPSLAKYEPNKPWIVEFNSSKSLICACTMVYNVGKVLREWVMYHSNIGVNKFILYDNDSDDDLKDTVEKLNSEGFDVRTVYWAWPKTQEAGFSHCALYANQLCNWVAFIDVDEFIFSPNWLESGHPNRDMVPSLLPKMGRQIGQVSIKCNEFGPSNVTVHPVEGVTQGYTCRRRFEQRHKSIVLLDALDHSLLNVVHHFKLKDSYRSSQVNLNRAVVNHYKYQAWAEFRAKFRRRVSAYVIDWRQNLNPMSNDRAPGLGFEAVEPPGWAHRFCEVHNDRLRALTRRWFWVNESIMAWQSSL